MELILREEIEKLGRRGDVVKVADGYAQNFLLPKRLAVPATEANKKIIEQERQAYLRREASVISEARELAELMKDVTVTIAHKAGEQEQLFGSVTPRNIADALAKQNYSVDHRKIQLNEPIKQLGEYKASVKIHSEVSVTVTVNVVSEDQPEKASASPESADEAASTAPVEAAPEPEPGEQKEE